MKCVDAMQSLMILSSLDAMPTFDDDGDLQSWRIDVPSHGYVELIDVMPRMIPEGRTCDVAITTAARVSYGKGMKSEKEDEGLLSYLMRHHHTSPFEQAEVKFKWKLPIFVARQIVRHRTANLNEVSGRYTVLPEEMYVPAAADVQSQSNTNKQGSEGNLPAEIAEGFVADTLADNARAKERYEADLANGVAREMARIKLPVTQYTEWVWKCDVHNLLHCLKLRDDSHAQGLTQEYARAICTLTRPLFPQTFAAWETHVKNAVSLSTRDQEAMRFVIHWLEKGLPLNSPFPEGVYPPGKDGKPSNEETEGRAKIARVMGQLAESYS